MTLEEYKAILDGITDEDRRLLWEQGSVYAPPTRDENENG